MSRPATTVGAVLLLAALTAVPAAAQLTIDEVNPSNPYPGHSVTIVGSDFDTQRATTDRVEYNGTSVPFRVITRFARDRIRARVPAGATSDGEFKVIRDDRSSVTSSTITLDTDPGLYGPRRALSFDGADDWISTVKGSDLGLANESFSVGVWFRLETTANDRTLVGMDASSTNEALHLVVKNDGRVRFGFYSNDLESPSGTVQTGTWTHLTFVYDASTGDRFIYKNGKQVASDNTSSDFQGTTRVVIGRWNQSNYFDGQIDQVRVWKGALSATEVRERAYRTISPGDAAFSELEATWRFDADASGTATAYEQTNNYRFGNPFDSPVKVAASGARLGQESVSTTGADATVGPSGGSLSATNVSTGADESVQLYRFGTASAPRRSNSDPGEDIDGTQTDKRSNLTWGLATTGSPSADLTIDYSNVQGVSSPVHLIRRAGPGAQWINADNWTHDSGNSTFSISGTVPEGQYAVKTGPIRTRLYVDKTAGGANDGSSWADAHTDLQTAIDNATPKTTIWVAQGVYTPDSEGDSFTITGDKDGLEIYGGFEGTETSRSSRDPKQHRTILSGDLNGDDTDPDGDGIVEDADPDNDGTVENLSGPNAHHVLVLDGGRGIGSDVSANVTTSTVIDGLYVTAGQADAGSAPDVNGGGLYCDGDGTGNACSPTLRNVVFAGNAAGTDGGAIYNLAGGGTASPQITNATFVGNGAEGGGAIYNNGTTGTASPQVTNTTFVDNAASIGGAVYNVAFSRSGNASPQITNATFTDNAASQNGGAIYNSAANDGTANPQIANTILWGDRADADEDGSGSGGEMYNGGASATLSHTIIEGGVNGSKVSGGANTDDGGNLDQSPRFADSSSPAGPDGTYATGDDGLNVTAGSPAFDAGDNSAIPSGVSADLTGADRTLDQSASGTATVNIGAYETAQPGPPVARTDAVQNVTGTSADVTGTASAAGLETTVQVQYFPSGQPSEVQTMTVPSSPLSAGDYTSRTVGTTLDGLTPGAEYTARILASNDKGSSQGSLTFTTSSGYTRRIAGTDGTGNDAGWRMLALPAAGKTRAALEDDVDFSVRTTDILYRWDGANQAWSAQTSSSDNLPRGEGLMLYLFDDSGEEIDSDGLPLAVSAGSEDQTADKTVSGLGQSEVFHLLGNPYDQAFDLGSLSGPSGSDLAASGFQATVQVWDPAAGSYTQITQGNSGDELPAWQGFFVERSTSGSGDTELTFAAGGKQSSDGSLIGSQSASTLLAGGSSKEAASKASSQHAEIPLTLTLTGGEVGTPPNPSGAKSSANNTAKSSANSTTETLVDRAVYWVDSRAGSGYDAYEARDLSPPTSGSYVTLAFPLDRSGTLVQRAQAAAPYPSSKIDRTVPVSVTGVGASGSATIALPDGATDAIPDNWTVRLTDTQTGATTNLRLADYTFDLAEGTALSSPSEARFELEVRDSTIPVELARFEGQSTEGGVRLTWQTASEQNNAGFRVLRKGEREDGSAGAWTEVGFVEGAGTTSEPQRYRFTDAEVPYAADTLRYRLKQVDTDGAASYTEPVTIARSGPDRLQLLGTYPNPARTRATVRYGVPESVEGTVRLRLYDVLGRRVRAGAAAAEAGRHEQALDVSGLPSGVYVLRLRAGGQVVTRKLTVVH